MMTRRGTAVEPAGGLGRRCVRVEGRDKVTGAARYAAEWDGQLDEQLDGPSDEQFPAASRGRPLHAVIVDAPWPAAEDVRVDVAAAMAVPGVVDVIHAGNIDRLSPVPTFPVGPAGTSRMPMQDDRVRYEGEPVAVVAAENFETARYAAMLVGVTGRPVRHRSFEEDEVRPLPEKLAKTLNETRGNPVASADGARHAIESTYRTPAHSHNALEFGSVVADWDGNRLSVRDSTQWVLGVRNALSRAIGLDLDQIRVVAPMVGGGFGCKCFCWPHEILAAVAAMRLSRPIQLVINRPQNYKLYGSRPAARQTVKMAADEGGSIVSIQHDAVAETSVADVFCRNAGELSLTMYDVANASASNTVVPVHRTTPTNMRAPGESYGSFATESAIDELAAVCGVDPLTFRLDNLAVDRHPGGQPWSSFRLDQCLRSAAEMLGWDEFESGKVTAPKGIAGASLYRGRGIAAAAYGGYRSQAAVRLAADIDGRLHASTASHEIGSGTTTLVAQAVASVLDVSPLEVAVTLGDTDSPAAPVQGASRGAASITPAATAAAKMLLEKLSGNGRNPKPRGTAAIAEAVRELAGRNGEDDSTPSKILGDFIIEVTARSGPPELNDEDFETLASGVNTIRFPTQGEHARYAFAAHAVEVTVDGATGEIRVDRVVSRVAAGRILNPMAAHSQVLGGLVMGISQTLLEGHREDPTSGRSLTAHPLRYPFAELGQIPPMDIAFVDDPDPHVGPSGAKGVGEIGVVGIGAAIANAVADATGHRLRHLPLRHPPVH